MKLVELLDATDLKQAESEGYVRRQVHPFYPLAILNYTERAQYEHVWTDVTRKCRGLIYNVETGDVVARPFEKFFNYGEHAEAELNFAAPVTVTDKMDGSLGIMYPSPDHPSGWAIATRGSFTSDQALHATKVLNENPAYVSWAKLQKPTRTPLFEIIYPENRIVLDYQGMDDLVWLDTIIIADGQSFFQGDWPGEMTEVFDANNLFEALRIPDRPNAEGVVVKFPDGSRVKIKQDDYVQLHRLITGMNARVVWERLGEGQTAADICRGIPEEFWKWVYAVADELNRKATEIIDAATKEYFRISDLLPEGKDRKDFSRKDFAALAVKSEYRAYLFQLLDGRDISGSVWRTLKPSAERAMTNYTEDVA